MLRTFNLLFVIVALLAPTNSYPNGILELTNLIFELGVGTICNPYINPPTRTPRPQKTYIEENLVSNLVKLRSDFSVTSSNHFRTRLLWRNSRRHSF